LIKGLLARRQRQLDRKADELKQNAVHNKHVDRVHQRIPKLKRYKYMVKKPTVPPPSRRFDRVIEKDRICHFEQLATVIL